MRKSWRWLAHGFSLKSKNGSFEEIRKVCLYAGFAGIEGGSPLFEGRSDAELETIGRNFREDGLCIESFHLPFSLEDDISCFYETKRREAVSTMRVWMEKAKCLGSSICIQHPCTDPSDAQVEGNEPYHRQLARSLETLLPMAEELGVKIAIENMLPPKFGSQAEHFQWLLGEFDSPHLGFCFDTGHALIAGGPEHAADYLEAMAPKLIAFHLADNPGDRDLHLAPGRGLVDWNDVFRKMAEIGFQGSANIEAGPFAPGPDYSREAWRQMVLDTEVLVAEALGSE